ADYLRNFYELGKAGLARIGDNEPMAYLIPAGQGRDENVAKMVGALVEQGVEVYRLDRELHAVSGEQSMRRTAALNRTIAVSSDRKEKEVPAGSYIIFLDQPYRQNVLALFEPQIYPDRTTATGEAERPYDVAGWTLPMSMGIETPAVISITEAANQRKLSSIKSENDVRKDFALPVWTSDKSPIENPIKSGIRVAVY